MRNIVKNLGSGWRFWTVVVVAAIVLSGGTWAVFGQNKDVIELTEVEELRWENQALRVTHAQQVVQRLMGALEKIERDVMSAHGVTVSEYSFDRDAKVLRKILKATVEKEE